MAARSVTIKLDNKFDVALVFDHDSIQHGVWGTNPPSRVEAGTLQQWVAESDGVATGTEGTVWYRLDAPGSTGLVRLHWDNPFIGSNNFDQSGPPVVTVTRVGDGSGDDATAHWVVADASTTGDGIPDAWKISGATIDPGDGSGPQFIDLPAMGATVGKPDIFVHLDWMEDPSHSHRPSAAAIKMVVDAFRDAPFIARNGAVGINLHVDAGPDSVMNHANGATWGALSRASAVGEVTQLGTTTVDGAGNIDYDWTDFDKLKNRAGGLTKSGRAPIFRYAVAAHQIGSIGNSGVARTIPGSDFIISLGNFAAPVTDMQTAGTFMHELGHALGLDHGGSDGDNNKPNYLSVMNYLWQMSGINRGGAFVLDYSRVALALLKEAGLNETIGLGPGSANHGTARWVPGVGGAAGSFVQVANAAGPIDWNGDGAATNANVPFDINGDGVQSDLKPCNDWQILKLRGGSVGSGGYAPPTVSSIPHELTPADQARIKPLDTTPPVTTASLWPAPNTAGWSRTPVLVTLTATDDISGVARTEYDLDGLGPVPYAGPVTVPDEGVHSFGYRSIDHSQNVEARKQTTVRIDLTAPEVVIHYDALLDDIIVEGRDGLSGVAAGPVPIKSRSDVEWTPFGSDVAELRVYEVRDRADNTTTLYLKVRCSPFAYEASVLAIVYDDASHHGRDPAAEREALALQSHDSAYAARARVPRNTLVFERVIGRNAAKPLLGVRQIVAIGERDARRTVRARWDALDDYTILVRETGAGSCGPCRKDDAHDDPRPDEPGDGHGGQVGHGGNDGGDQNGHDDRPCREDQRERDERKEREEREQTEERKKAEERKQRDERKDPASPAREAASPPPCRCGGGGGEGHPPTTPPAPKPGDTQQPERCGFVTVSETDIRGLVVLHVVSEDGRLHVLE